MFLKFVALCFLWSTVLTKKTKSSELVQITDLKDWKKELRTKNNVLALFTKDSKKSSKLLKVLDSVSVQMRGKATIISVDCTEAAKLCKKLKISPKPHILNHYNSGEFNKAYDRKESEQSMVLFLEDPLGDVPWSEEGAAKDVMHLDYQSFKRLLRKTELPVLTMFYAPWCGHCKRMKPEFNGAATAMKGKALLVGIDADGSKGAGPSQEYNVTSFPTILYFERGTFKFKFSGDRTKDGIVTWLENPTEETSKPEAEEKTWAEEDESPVAHLTTDTFKPFLAQHDSVLVMFYAPWCGHCKAMKPEYSKSAVSLEEQGISGKLAAVDVTTNRPLGDEYGVKGFPTVVYFKKGNKTFEHPGLREEPDIVSFMKDPKEPPPPAPEEAPWSEQESSVSHLTGVGDFDKAVKRKKHSMVMFYAPWCGHCKKAKPEFTAAAEQLADNNKVLLAAVDCTNAQNKDVCGRYGVKGYPTVVYLSYGAGPHIYSGSRDQNGFFETMSSEDPSSGMSPLETPGSESGTVAWGGEGVVVHVATTEHDTFLLDSTPSLMLYYKKGCSTCKSVQDAFTAAGQLLQYHSVTFSGFQCPPRSHNPHCSGNEPRIVMYYSQTRHVVYSHSTTSSRDMVNFINSVKDEL